MEEGIITPTTTMASTNSSSPSWKLYHNPHFSHQHRHRSRSPPSMMDRANLSDLDNALTEIKLLRSELELERQMRRKVESLNESLTMQLEAAKRKLREEAERAATTKTKETKAIERVEIKEMVPIMTIQRKDQQSAENPHIKRGIKGLEFPRAVRVRNNSGFGSSPRSREGRGAHLGSSSSNLECQRAQLRVLMRNKSSVAAAAAAENLVKTQKHNFFF